MAPAHAAEDGSTTTPKRKRGAKAHNEVKEERKAASYAEYDQSEGDPTASSTREGYNQDQGDAYPPPQDLYQSTSAVSDAYPPPPLSTSAPSHAYPPPPDDVQGTQPPYARSNGFEPPVDPSIATEQDRAYVSESHLAEALQRENRNYDAMAHDAMGHQALTGEPLPTGEGYPASPDDEGHSQYGTYGGTRERDPSMGDSDRKRRKRVFSNRTKTGCMTCRRRKKKCDEGHPECQNCIRGGFVCEGYTSRGTWQKPANAKGPASLQNKNGYASTPQQDTPQRAPYSNVGRYTEDTPAGEYPSPSQSALQPPRMSSDMQRDSLNPEDDSIYGRSTPPSQKGGRPYPSAAAAAAQAASRYSGTSGTFYDASADPSDTAMHDPSLTGRDEPSIQQEFTDRPQSPAKEADGVQAAAQAALTHPASSRVSGERISYDHLTNREKMLQGQYYYPMTPALIEDREQCIDAVWRFNNATNPVQGSVNREERIRLFRQILALRPTPEPPLASGEVPEVNGLVPFGGCGENVHVDAPFYCDYGYNITIGDSVSIGADCRISDTCTVSIGSRTIFSPGVKLICATYPIDPRRRNGSEGPALGRNIVIEEDCWIGANVTILAGVKVGKNSTVGAGSLLHQDVPKYTVVAGNPAKVSREIYETNEAPTQ